MAISRTVRELRLILKRQRRREQRLRADVASLEKKAAQPVSAVIAGALAERDRQLADVQREADTRLAELEAAKQEADLQKTEADIRLRDADERLAELEATTKEADIRFQESEEKKLEIQRITEEADRRLDEVRAATLEAERRNELLIESNKAVEQLDAALRAKTAEADSLYKKIATLNGTIKALQAQVLQRSADSQVTSLEAQVESLKALIAALEAQVESLRMQLEIVTEAAQERLVALESNSRAVSELRRQLAQRESPTN